VAVATLLFGASGVFAELQDSLNIIWDAPPGNSSGWIAMIKQRVISFGMVLALGLLLLVSLLLSAGLGLIEEFFSGLISVHAAALGEAANFVISLVGVAVLFALIFKFVPNVRIDWRDVIVGGVATAILFSIGRALLALYLRTTGIGSAYGAAGSLVALVVWVYYSAQIFFFGAEFTRVYADLRRSRRVLG
jgi:membrane protein